MLTKHSAYSFLLLLLSPPLQADALTDGTLGPSVHLTDPHFTIGENLGQRVGTNLFHSFEHFNVPTEGSATFTGSLGIQNVLARVTGPTSSNIDGTLRSTIPEANLYLMNPNGILFGPNARLDLSGSFHATTADTIKLGADGEFNARTPTKSLLTVASPSAFGFLSGPPAAIEMQGSFLQVPEGKGLSVVGGDISMENAILSAPDGQINLASVASPLDYGEVIPSQDTLQLTGFTKLGHLNISQRPTTEMPIGNVDVSGEGGGQIFIRGGQFTTQGAFIFSDTHGSKAGKGINIDITGDINLAGGGTITADSLGAGKGGNISITATDSISLFDQPPEHLDIPGTVISANSYANGDAGDIRINTPQLEITSSLIASSPQADATGSGGNIFIKVGKLLLKDAAQIQGITFGEGNGGNIDIQADSILMSAAPELYDWGLTNLGVSLSSSISVGVEPNATGAGGKISITANHLELQGNAFIISQTLGPGKGGDLVIKVKDNFTLFDNSDITRSGLSSLSDGLADAGNIFIDAGRLVLRDNSFINSGTYPRTASDAGPNDGNLAPLPMQFGGGNIRLSVTNHLYLFNGTITAEARGVRPEDNGGNLTISHPHLFIMDEHSKLSAQADVGNGGNIKIEADNFLNPIPKNVTAASKRGIDGEVTINALAVDLSGSFNFLTTTYFRPLTLNKQACTIGPKQSSFRYIKLESSYPVPTDLQFYAPEFSEISGD